MKTEERKTGRPGNEARVIV